MFKFLLAAAVAATAASPLASCNQQASSDIAAFNTAVNNDLPTACNLVATADAAFQAVAATGTLKAVVVSEEAAAMAGVKTICANPSGVNAANALITLADAYAAIVEAANAQ
jgi:hypothetical protein